LLLLAAVPVAAKKPLEKITIAGPGLPMPVESTDEKTLRLANPWFGRFIEWNAPAVKARHNAAVYDVISIFGMRRGRMANVGSSIFRARESLGIVRM